MTSCATTASTPEPLVWHRFPNSDLLAKRLARPLARPRLRHGTMLLVSFVLIIAAAAILGGVVAVAMGWGGEISLFARDIPEVSLRPRTPYDVAMLRLPAGLLGYQRQATDDALHEVAGLLADRDAEIARLADELSQFAPPAAAGAPERSAPPPVPPAAPLP